MTDTYVCFVMLSTVGKDKYVAVFTTPAAPAPMKAVPAEPVVAEAPAPTYASASQKEEIIRLLNHPVITRPEKTKMLLNINRLDEERAMQAIAKLRKAIDDRENGHTAAAA